MIAKRGVIIDAVYFHAPPYTSDRAKQKVVDLAKLVADYSGPINLHVVNFTDIQLYIYEQCPHDELTIIMRRYMMKIAEYFALKEDSLGLITGESIGQVASQTMQSLAVTNEVCTLPVLRPLVGMDKQEIINISEKIGTYETSILPFEDCCTIFVAKHPVTKPNLKQIKKSELKLNEKQEKPSYKVNEGDIIKIEKEEPQEIDLKPQEIPIDIIYEDKDILIINKAKGMVVHPGNGNPDGTLVNAVMAKCKDSLSGIGGKIRPGVVHRIDKDTSRTNNNCQE